MHGGVGTWRDVFRFTESSLQNSMKRRGSRWMMMAMMMVMMMMLMTMMMTMVRGQEGMKDFFPVLGPQTTD